MTTGTPEPSRRRSPSWTRRRGIPESEAQEHSPWLRLHEHLAVRHGIRADLPRRWERPLPDDPRNLPALLRQASAQVDRELSRALPESARGLTPLAVDALRRLREKPSSGVNLAEYLVLSERRVSRLLLGLEGAGLVSREPGWLDLRTRRTEITEHGRVVLGAIEQELRELTAIWLEGLEPEEVDALLHLLHALSDRPPSRQRRGPRRRLPARSAQLQHPVVDAAEAGDGQVVNVALHHPPRSA
ncbi:winged helix-turn-helix transcriptional regulator [Phycicoccus sp. HDW14]|uniref:MarR family winged helix-turn-helix transcriptional regulator n=1 Tax=Phycicoccus sp. HDW14 TaxID=2714941 RepID=UPI00140CA100|nr:MarR family winged helix-turn-helix transcriptional regulator [Phycicoccus sp. HDW14]QIM20510.1 winged helix-turn-helix transcriptional regulator [Phycicoccus sp. HDW14]